MLEAGASRLGMSAGIAVLREMDNNARSGLAE
jgi:deoxyribose-phosphate aldolase